MPTRRSCLVALLAAPVLPGPVSAQEAAAVSSAEATGFINDLGQRMMDVVNGGGSAASKRAAFVPILEGTIDIDGIAQFCLGQYWRRATEAQQREYVTLFHRVLATAIGGHLGEYSGVSFSITGARPRGEEMLVGTIVRRPNNAPINAQWVVARIGGKPRLADVLVEGTSLRLTQRSDYTSFLSRNGGSVAALIAALGRQLDAAQAG